MKKLALVLALILFVSLASASIGTFTGELEKQGPEAEFTVGLASDEPLQVELEVQEIEGLNITYNQSYSFDPDDVDRSYQRGTEVLPVKEYSVRVESIDAGQEAYSVPVTFRVYSEESQSGTSPQVIHEREYEFSYITDLSPSYGWNGSLIDGGENSEDSGSSDRSEEGQSDESLDLDEDGSENTLTKGNETINGEKNENSTDRTTMILLVMILFLSVYILREALG